MQTFTFFSTWKKDTFFFSRAAFLVAVRQRCSLKEKKSVSSLKKGLEKPGPLPWLCSVRCCILPSPAACRGRRGTMLFSIGSATGDYGMRLWQMDIPIKFFRRVEHSINHWHYPNPSETLGHFFSCEQEMKGENKGYTLITFLPFFFLLRALW